ncbi:hypothetical protein KNO81_12350 [Paraburkholderia sediminicola]|nr:hypothetical protein [Paraburkholderia sediminicola]
MKNQYEKAPAGAFQQMKATIEEIEEDIEILEAEGHHASAEVRRKLEKLRVQFAALSGERLDDR